MADLASMIAQLDTLQDARAMGVLKARMGDEEVTYRADSEMVAAISDLQSRIRLAQGQPAVRTVRLTSSKGL